MHDMNIDFGQIVQTFGSIKFPIGKADIIHIAQQHGANDQVVSMLDLLPNKTFNSMQDVQDTLSALGNFGNLGNLGGLRR